MQRVEERGHGDTVRGNVKESEGKGEKEAKKRCPRVDPIGAPNLGIRICSLICGFHRNCLSTRRLATGTSHIHLLYATRSTAGPREDTRVSTFSRVFPSRETSLRGRLSPVGNRIHVPPLFFLLASWRTLPSSSSSRPATQASSSRP